MLSPSPLTVRLLLWRLRLPVAALLAGCACALAVAELRPASEPTARVVVAARDLTLGQPLELSDLATAAVPERLVPAGATGEPGALVGRSTAVDVPRGLTLVDSLIAAPVVAGPPGTVVAPVRFADAAVAALLTPGTRVDVLASDLGTPGASGTVLARGALVLAPPAEPAPRDGGLLDPGGSAPADAPVLLAVTGDEALALAGSVSWAVLAAVIVT